MTIGQLAKRLAVNPRTIRFYEHAGVLPEPERTPSGYRLYSDADEERLRFIKSAQRLGFSLGEIKEILHFRDRGQPPCRYVAELLDRRLGEINQGIRELRELKRQLSALRERMRSEGLATREGTYCHYLESAAPGATQPAKTMKVT